MLVDASKVWTGDGIMLTLLSHTTDLVTQSSAVSCSESGGELNSCEFVQRVRARKIMCVLRLLQ